MRDRSEWITHRDESLRIVTDALWDRAQVRMNPAKGDKHLKCGGKPRHLLSGLLRCSACGAHYTIADKFSYSCSSNHDGNACGNTVRVRRDRAEEILLGPINEQLLAPDRVERMAAEMRTYFAERNKAMQARATEAPRELQELGARIDRLRERLRKGDPDMPTDEIQAAIDRAEAKRAELQDQQPEAKQSAKVLAMLPRAAEMYRRQIAEGLSGDERAAGKARVFLRDWFGGRIQLEALPDGGLMAHWNENAAALLRTTGTFGSGGLSWISSAPEFVDISLR